MRRANSLLYNLLLLIGDFVALLAAFSIAYIIRVKIDERSLIDAIPANQYAGVIAVLLVFWLMIFALLGLYRNNIFDNRLREFLLLLVGSFVGILFLIGSEYVLNRPIFPARLVVVYGFLLSFFLTLLSRTLIRATMRWRFLRGRGLTNVLLVGSTTLTNELAASFKDPRGGYRIIGVVGKKNSNLSAAEAQIFGSFNTAVKEIGADKIHAVVQTELYPEESKNDQILKFVQEQHTAYRFIPGNGQLFSGNLEVELFQGIPTIAVHQTALTGWGRIFKRVFDFIFGLIFLSLSLPLLAIIWLLITIFGGGSAVFKQTRASRFGQTIQLYKFRTHKLEYCGGLTPEQAFAKMGRPELAKIYRENGDRLDDDPRVTRIGRFLRKTSLDELPQLFNVVRGDLSLVGPRPLIPEEMQQAKKQNLILSVKPGITGLAVISGRKNISFEERRRLDTFYVQNWSFYLDLNILVKTFGQVLTRAFSDETD